ncbi:hypothetical protein [Glutamicibacter sp. NPDC087344]|uniref:hypothetical protein n=1 Tax=Glutamicibacter sp. NPDC087344 TaxID=3363994 RepID=UPI00382E063A
MVNQLATSSLAVRKDVPLRSLSEDEWARVPRSIPDAWISAGTWIPLAALLFYLICFAPQPIVFGSWAPIVLSYSFFIGLLVLLVGARRHAPWIGLAASAWFLSLLEPTGLERTVLYCAIGYFAVLAASVAIGQIRFASLLGAWRRGEQGHLPVELSALKPLKYSTQLPTWVWSFTGALVAWPLVKTAWKFFTDADMDFAAVDPALYYELGVGFAVLALIQLIAVLRWIESRSMPPLALEIPVLPGLGPLGFTGVGAGLPVAEGQSSGCGCAEAEANTEVADFKHPGWMLTDQHCAVHGIRAVNELAPDQFLAIARQPWVYGKDASRAPHAGHQRMVIVGLHGWGATPRRVNTSVLSGGGMQAPTHLLPGTAREPVKRADRKLKWVDPRGKH